MDTGVNRPNVLVVKVASRQNSVPLNEGYKLTPLPFYYYLTWNEHSNAVQ